LEEMEKKILEGMEFRRDLTGRDARINNVQVDDSISVEVYNMRTSIRLHQTANEINTENEPMNPLSVDVSNSGQRIDLFAD